jgi:hypothetical protein
MSNIPNCKIYIKFKGTKIRIIGSTSVNRSANIEITIDGAVSSFSMYSASLVDQVLVYEKVGLPNAVHTVQIRVADALYMHLDSIDIDDSGILMFPSDTKQNIFDINVGDAVIGEYYAASGLMGAFANLGKSTKTVIPVGSSATPSGSFYWRHVGYDGRGRKKLIADRNIQSSIAWDILNKAGIVTSEVGLRRGLIFNGVDSYINIPYNVKHCPTTTLTVKATIERESSSSTFPVIIGNFQAAGYGLVNSDTMAGFQVYVNGGYVLASVPNSTIPTGKHELCGTYDGRYVRFYVDGLLVATKDAGASYSITYNTSTYLCIGANPSTNGAIDAGGEYKGILYDASVWNVALSDSQVAQYYNQSLVGDESGLVSNWEIIGLEGSTLILDKTSNRLNGTAYNCKWYDDLFDNRYRYSFRLLSGGNSATDTNNEWDKIIVSSTLNGTTDAGLNSVWAWSGVYSWTSTVPTSANANRVVRGNTAMGAWTSGTNLNYYGFRPVLLVEDLAVYPTLNVLLDKESTFEDPINVQVEISGLNSTDTVQYRILIGEDVVNDWSDSSITPVTFNAQISSSKLGVGENTIHVECMVTGGWGRNYLTNVIRKDIDSLYASSSECFNYKRTLMVGGEYVSYIRPANSNTAKGYLKSSQLTLNLLSDSLVPHTIKVAPITTEWSSSSTSFGNLPSVDMGSSMEFSFTDSPGLVNLNSTQLLEKMFGRSLYGVAIFSSDTPVELSTLGNDISIVYQPTELYPPQEIFGTFVEIKWKPLVLEKARAFLKLRLKRSSSPDMTGATTLIETNDINTLVYPDASVTNGTYYYAVEVEQVDNPYIGDSIDFDLADESLFIQQDTLCTEFTADGKLRLQLTPTHINTSVDFSSGTGYTCTSGINIQGGVAKLKGAV